MLDEEVLPHASDFDVDGTLSRDFLLRRGNWLRKWLPQLSLRFRRPSLVP